MLGGKPLVAWAIELGLAAESVDRVVVSSDDDEVLAVAAAYEGVLALRRPDALSTDTAPAIDYVRHALESLAGEGDDVDVVLILQPSSPLTQASDVDATVRLLRETGAESAVSVMQVDHATHPVKMKTFGSSGKLLPYVEEERGRMAAHELPDIYVRNCAVYATRRDVVEQGEIIGNDSRGYVMPRERSVDINDELDLAFAEFLFARGARG